jgi:hypothetical protein
MDTAILKNVIRTELPVLLRDDPSLREYILNTTRLVYPDKQNTDDRIMRILDELRLDREEQRRKWEENKAESDRKWEEQSRKWEENKAEFQRKWEESRAESDRKWEEQNRKWAEDKAESYRKWEEQNRKWDANQKAINDMIGQLKKQDTKLESKIGALGARWGIFSEESFRNGLRAILEESFGVQVVNVTEYDDDGLVFGRPDQVELDVIIYNGMLILCEIKSSMSKSDVHIFDRKTTYYEKRHNREATRKMIISPMVDKRALGLAKKLGIEVYSHSYDVSLDQNEESCNCSKTPGS